MAQVSQHPSYLLIEDQLDAVGQKYRVQRILAGLLMWLCGAAVSSFAAAMAAHHTGQSNWTYAVLAAWGAWLALSLLAWVVWPMVLRPRPAQVARLIEGRLDGLHNGLTNSVLLSKAADLQASPWLGAIFDEILQAARGKSLDQAVRITDLKPLLKRIGMIVAPLVLALAIPGVRQSLGHGWRQMFAPTAFVPTRGEVEILDVQPKGITLVAGQPLEITVLARHSKGASPDAALIFDNHKTSRSIVVPTPTADNVLRYSYRLEHVEQPMRYRVEIDGTQSAWFDVHVVKQIKLQRLAMEVMPPGYTRLPTRSIEMKPEEIGKTVIAIPEGSKVVLTADVDVAAGGALLHVEDSEPAKMDVAGDGRRFTGSFYLHRQSSVAVMVREGEQIIARLPEPPLTLHCTPDAAPSIGMKWPTQDVSVPLDQELKIAATVRDDYGLSAIRVLSATKADAPLAVVHEKTPAGAVDELAHVLSIPTELRKHGQSIRVQIEAVDNRRIPAQPSGGASSASSVLTKDLGPQTVQTAIFEIKFRDARELARIEKEQTDKLRALIQQMLEKQRDLHSQTKAWQPADKQLMPRIAAGQTDLRSLMLTTAQTFAFEQDQKIVQKTLLMLVHNPAKDAIDLSTAIQTELVEKERQRLWSEVQTKQRRIISTLESLLAMLNLAPDPTTKPATQPGGDLPPDKREVFKNLKNDLEKFIKEEQRILDQTAHLAKKPVDNFNDKDKKTLAELVMAQEKMDAFISEKVSDFSKLAEQDMANSSLLKELMEVYSEVTMAKDALKQKALEIAVPLEESGLELAKEITSNLEKWLMDTPDRTKWTMEEPVGKQDVPMAELPKELEDMVGELMEDQEDIFEEMEDAGSQWADSLDKGAGWDAMDGPIANMSAKGVTGNANPNDMEMGGRSGEGRSGKSSGEMVEETASGKGGRNTPTRLDPTPFQKGQIKDESKDPQGGATGGGKLSGQGGQGLEGPLNPKKLEEQLKRIGAKQAQLRNKAERLNLDYKVGKFDQFKLLEAIAIMRRVESDFKANRYDNALRRRDVLLDRMDESKLLLGAAIHVKQDTSPMTSQKVQEQINDAMKGQLPAAWKEALNEYYKKLARE